MSIYRIVSCVARKRCLLWSVCSLDKILLTLALFHFVLQDQTCQLIHGSLDFLLLHSNPLWWKGHLFWVLILEGLVGLHQFSSVQFSCSVMSDSLRPHGVQPTRLFRPWDFPGKSTGVGCHCLLHQLTTNGHSKIQIIYSVQFSSVAQSCLTLCDPTNRSMPGLPVHHQIPEFTQTHVHWGSDAIQPSHPLSSPSPPAPNPSQHQSLFQWVNSSHEVAKVLEFQL